jgi:S1-C subfamily serine protease
MDTNENNEPNEHESEESSWVPEHHGLGDQAPSDADVAPTTSGAHWRPGSPVRPMGGATGQRPFAGSAPFADSAPFAGSEVTGAPAVARTPVARRRLPVMLTAISLLAAAGAGVGIGVAVKDAGSPVTTTAQGNSSSGSLTTPSSGGAPSGGVTNPYGGSSTYPYQGGGLGSGSSSSSSGSNSVIAGSGAPSDVSSIAAKVTPGLVDINSTFNYQEASGAGTGIVLTSNGEVITNNHVINGATSISVTDLGNGKTYSAKVVGYDASEDVAVIQLQNASGLTTASIGDSSSATVGEPIVAIGNAGGTGGTPTSAGGSITGLNQSVSASDELDGLSEQLKGLIGVNADVQPGDSGGSLVNSSGQVLGIDTAGSSGSSTFEFSGQSAASEAYAIPINDAMSIAKQIESGTGTSTIHVGETAFIGIEVAPTSSDNEGGSSGIFGGESGGSTSTTTGATISSVVAGGTAATAGLGDGDVITTFDGKTVDSSSTLTSLLVPLHPGDKVELGWTDTSGQTHSATVVLGSGPPA